MDEENILAYRRLISKEPANIISLFVLPIFQPSDVLLKRWTLVSIPAELADEEAVAVIVDRFSISVLKVFGMTRIFFEFMSK